MVPGAAVVAAVDEQPALEQTAVVRSVVVVHPDTREGVHQLLIRQHRPPGIGPRLEPSRIEALVSGGPHERTCARLHWHI
jgi:hypothetical protein